MKSWAKVVLPVVLAAICHHMSWAQGWHLVFIPIVAWVVSSQNLIYLMYHTLRRDLR